MLAFRIALRYLFSKKTHTAVNVISLISVIGVAVASMAVVVVLSIYNGFAELASSQLSVIDPEVKVLPVSGKVITSADSLATVLAEDAAVAYAVPTLEERGLLIYNDQQLPVVFKGVTQDYSKVTEFDRAIVIGSSAQYIDTTALMQIAVGVSNRLDIVPGLEEVATLYTPRRVGRINPANPSAAFMSEPMYVSGVFRINQQEYDDDHIVVPIETARRLLDYSTEATSIEIKLNPGVDPKQAISSIKSRLGNDFKVLDRMQQQERSFRMIAIEKWVTFLLLSFIMVIASFNIISTLSLLVLEKRENIAVMRAMGVRRNQVRSIFIIQGWLISLAGGIIGIVLGIALSLAQQYGKIIKLNANPATLTTDAYPVKVNVTDILVVMALVALVGLVTSQITRFFIKKDS